MLPAPPADRPRRPLPGDDPTATRRLRRAAWIFTALLWLVTWGAVVAVLKTQWDQTLESEAVNNGNLARALQEQTARVLATVDQATLRVRDAVQAGESLPELTRYANETGLAPKILVQLSLVGPDGRFQGSNLDPDGRQTGPVDLSGREHIKVHLAPGAPAVAEGGLFIGKPVLGKVSKRWTIQLSRRISSAGGEPLGVVVASLDPGYFEQVYRQVDLGPLGGVTLVGSDLTIRARVVGGEATSMGGSFGPDGVFARRAPGPGGHAVGLSSVDGAERISAWRQVAEYPLYVVAATATEQTLAPWRATRNVMAALALLLTLAVGAAAAILVSSLRRLEASHDALRASEAQAQSANAAKTEFLAAISHELRTPLTSIRGFAELLEHRLEAPAAKEQAGLIRRNAEHLGTLLGEILDMARVEAGAMPVNSAPETLRPLLQGCAELFGLSARAKGLTLDSEVAANVPETLLCDGLRLKQILNNLLSNAVKFTAQGGIRMQVEATPEQVIFHVIDSGPGIPAEKQSLVFEKFRQGDDRVSYQHGGTGLGLALARALAECMGGQLTLASEPGQGCRFTLRLPNRS